MVISKQSASSALFICIAVLTQHTMLSSSVPVVTTDTTSTTAPPPTTTQRPFTFDVYPESRTLMRKVITSGLYQQLRGGATLPAGVQWSPTALWNSTDTNKMAACHKYLRDNGLDQPSAGSCAASYVCNVTENLHRFPAVLIHAECGGSESKCVDSYHTGLGVIDGSRGNCQAKSHHRVSYLVFKPAAPTAEELASIQARNATGSGVPEPTETTVTQLKGEWVWYYEYLPLNCQCKAK